MGKPTGWPTCQMLEAAAAANDIPLSFFARLIWQESRFNRWIVSRSDAAVEDMTRFLREFQLGAAVQIGVFGAQMEVSLTNSGPVTILLDSEV